MKPRGLSLVETILSFFILSLVLMLLFNLYPTAVLASRRAEQSNQAHGLARSILAEHRARGFAQLAEGSTTLPEVTRDGTTYRPVVEVFDLQDVDPRADPGLIKGVRVKVSWSERSGTRSETDELWISNVAP